MGEWDELGAYYHLYAVKKGQIVRVDKEKYLSSINVRVSLYTPFLYHIICFLTMYHLLSCYEYSEVQVLAQVIDLRKARSYVLSLSLTHGVS